MIMNYDYAISIYMLDCMFHFMNEIMNAGDLSTYTVQMYLQGWGYAWLAQIPVHTGAILIQKLHQSWYVHIVIIVKMTEPSLINEKQ